MTQPVVQPMKQPVTEPSGLAIRIDRTSKVPVFEQICAAVRARSGVMAAGASLPPTRAWAIELGVSRSTVVSAYEQLVAEGYLSSLPGSGYTLCPVGAVELQKPDPAPDLAAPGLTPPETAPGLRPGVRRRCAHSPGHSPTRARFTPVFPICGCFPIASGPELWRGCAGPILPGFWRGMARLETRSCARRWRAMSQNGAGCRLRRRRSSSPPVPPMRLNSVCALSPAPAKASRWKIRGFCQCVPMQVRWG
jgi:regulatory GntR family protein